MNEPANISMALLSGAVAAVIALSSPAVARGGTELKMTGPTGSTRTRDAADHRVPHVPGFGIADNCHRRARVRLFRFILCNRMK